MAAFDPGLYEPSLLEGLAASFEKDQFPHTLLIHGARGSGKSALAVRIAQRLLCQNRDAKDLAPCPCASCRRIAEGAHPDVKSFTNFDEAAVKVASIRELMDWLRFRPLEGHRKALILERAERLVDAALNAFLKTLEEPPASSCLILLAESPGLLKPTLLSRCFLLRLRPLSPDRIAEKLLAKGAGPEEARYLSRLSGGAWPEAERMLAEGAFERDRERLENLLGFYSYELAERCLGRTAGGASQEDRRKTAGEHLRVAEIFLRDVLLAVTHPDRMEEIAASFYFPDHAPQILQYARAETRDSVFQKMSRMEEIRKDLRSYGNPRLGLIAVRETLGAVSGELARV